jgi:hypothetical protein
MITLQAKASFIDEEHDQAVVAVQTSRCFYRVAIQGTTVTVVGPGVEEQIELTDEQHELNYEGIAAIAVLALEERQ